MAPVSNVELLMELRRLVGRVRPRLDTGQGVKMLYSDIASLSNPVWTVGLNPGGSHMERDQWYREDGAHDYRDGYLDPATRALRPGGLKLRVQLAGMMKWLGLDWSDTLSLNLVPFRCASWNGQPAPWRSAAIAFAEREFWPLLLTHRRPRLVVCFGNDAAKTIRRLFGHAAVRSFAVGWGNVTADVSGDGSTTILRVPHLSTFGIFVRPGAAGKAELAILRADRSLQSALEALHSTSDSQRAEG